MSDDSEAFIREIEEEVRREKLTNIWKQYGSWILGGLGGVVLLVALWQWYVTYQVDRVQSAGGKFYESLQLLSGDKESDGVSGLEQVVKEGTPAYAALAKMRLAAVQRTAGKNDEALALYTAVADDTSVDRLLSSFASLQIASLKVDDGTWTEVQNRLNDLADESSPWRYSARELLGVAAFKHKKWGDARQAYTRILIDQAAPQALKLRAQTALALITREDADTASEKSSPAGSTQSDPKKDKSVVDDKESTAGASATKSPPANGAGAEDDAEKKK